MDMTMFVVIVVAGVLISLIALYCLLPGLRSMSIFSRIGASLMRTRAAMIWLVTKPAVPFMLIWKFSNWLTRKDPKDLAPVLIWFVAAALLFKPLFGNPFSRNGWENAFDEPAGFLVYITIALVTLILITSGMRHGFFVLSDAWKRTYWRSLICLLVVGGVAYFLYFAIDDYLKKRPTESVIAATAQTTALTSLPASQQTASTSAHATQVPTLINLTGTQASGVKLFDLAPGKSAHIEYKSGQVCEKYKSNTECMNIWGFENSNLANYDKNRWRTPQYRYANVEGVSAGETLVILGQVGNEEQVFQFPEKETSIEVTNKTDKTLPLTLFLHVNEQSWTDQSEFTFPTYESAAFYGHKNAQPVRGFQAEHYEGAMSFRAYVLE